MLHHRPLLYFCIMLFRLTLSICLYISLVNGNMLLILLGLHKSVKLFPIFGLAFLVGVLSTPPLGCSLFVVLLIQFQSFVSKNINWACILISLTSWTWLIYMLQLEGEYYSACTSIICIIKHIVLYNFFTFFN